MRVFGAEIARAVLMKCRTAGLTEAQGRSLPREFTPLCLLYEASRIDYVFLPQKTPDTRIDS